MGKIVVETNYRRFKPVRQDDICASCPSACKTSCARKLAVKTELKHSETIESKNTNSRP